MPVKNKTVKILHTSLGFSIVAEVDEATAEIIYKEDKEKNAFLKHYKKIMADFVFVLIAVGFFALSWAMVRLCDRV